MAEVIRGRNLHKGGVAQKKGAWAPLTRSRRERIAPDKRWHPSAIEP